MIYAIFFGMGILKSYSHFLSRLGDGNEKAAEKKEVATIARLSVFFYGRFPFKYHCI